MTRLLVPLAVVLLTAATCNFEPAPTPAEGVILTRIDGAFELRAAPPVSRAFLVLPGTGLSTNHEDCEYDATSEDVACVFGQTSSETIHVEGEVVVPDNRLLGSVCRAECHPLFLTDAD